MAPVSQRVARLRAVAEAAPDAAGFFPAMYAEVTVAVEQRCADGRFDDPERMLRFVDGFAGYYLRAEADRASASRSWQASWDVAGDRGLLVAQHLLLGMNAHINLDLPQAVVEVADAGGGLAAVRADFDAVNDVLLELYGDVLRRLGGVARWTSTAASLGGGRLFRFSLLTARRQAWEAAQRLEPLDTAGRRVYVDELDRLTGVLAYLVTRPLPPVGWLLPLLRAGEPADPRVVTRALLGPSPR